jgi:Zn-finger nucleic acid-binding protein
MVKEVVAGVVIDRCPVCHGVWLDAGELQLVRDAARGEGAARAITSALAPLY